MTIGLEHYLIVSVVLFCLGLLGVIIRRNLIVMYMGLELMLNAANLQFAAAAVHHGDVTGWIYTVFAIAIAAAEVAIGLAILLSMYNQHETISLDEVELLKH